MSGEVKTALRITIVALFVWGASKYMDTILNTPELWKDIPALAIMAISLFIMVLISKSVSAKNVDLNEELKPTTMMVGGVLIGGFVSKSFDIVLNGSFAPSDKPLVFAFAFLLLVLIVCIVMKCINTDWLSIIRRWLANIRRRLLKILNCIFT